MAAPRVLIFGTGSLGIVLVAFLHNSGADVVCVCHSNYQVTKAHGLKVDSTAFGNYVYHPAFVQSVPEAATLAGPSYDYIVLCPKAFPDEDALLVEVISPAVSSDCSERHRSGRGLQEEIRG